MNPYASYQKNALESATREEIMLKLFEGAVIRLKQAMEEWQDGAKLRARELRSQALAIISELDSTLDRDNGDPQLIEELDALYAFMIQQINLCTIEDNFDRLAPVIDTLKTLYEAFEEAVKLHKSGHYENSAELENLAANDSSARRRMEMHG
jgi:flagellar protein FliS